MDKTPIYHQIAESIRQEILYGKLRPGDALPTVRELATRWRCTPGTVQKAYQELTRQGLVSAQAGQGTKVVAIPSEIGPTPLRQAGLVHQAEGFLLQALTAGHTPDEVEQALRVALDRWRAVQSQPPAHVAQELRFAGSHDPAMVLIAARFPTFAPGYTLRLAFTGSVGGLIALARGEADIAGCHLWDEASDTYNFATVQRVLPGQRLALLTLAHRRLGLLTMPGNPHGLAGLHDLGRPGLRFVNRQRGSGTRVWLDAQVRRLGLAPAAIVGYENEALTHSETARFVAEGKADVGLGVQAAAIAYGLGFVGLTTERYDLVISEAAWEQPAAQTLATWLDSDDARAAIASMGGYEVAETGKVHWVG